MPRRAMRGMMPRLRQDALDARESYALSACILSGRKRGPPRGCWMGGMLSSSGSSRWASGTLAPLTSTASGMPWRSTRM